MEKGDLILGKVNLNAYLKRSKKPFPIIELLGWEGACDGDIVVLEVRLKGRE